MKSVALWVFGASVAFLVTAGAFLALARFAEEPTSGDPIPRAEPATFESTGGGSAVALHLPEERLKGLEQAPGQRLAVGVENAGSEGLVRVDLVLDVAASENTAPSRTRRYKETVEDLAPAAAAEVEFEIDLSPPAEPPDRGRRGDAPRGVEEARRILLEIKATSPEGGYSDVKTAVLAS